MTYKTTIQHGANGLHAESLVQIGESLDGKRMLELYTSKGRGGLVSSARVKYHNEAAGIITFAMFGDFSKPNIAFTPCKRATQKAVSQAHEIALLKMDEIIEEAKAFYVEEDKKNAA